MLTWLDVLALSFAALATAIGARRGAGFTLALVPALGLYLAVVLAVPNAALLPVAAFFAGLVAGALAGRLRPRFPPALDTVLGGVGGLTWGALLAVALWVGLPSEYSPATGTLRYPSSRLPLAVQRAVSQSPFAPQAFALVWGNPTARALFLPGRPRREP